MKQFYEEALLVAFKWQNELWRDMELYIKTQTY